MCKLSCLMLKLYLPRLSCIKHQELFFLWYNLIFSEFYTVYDEVSILINTNLILKIIGNKDTFLNQRLRLIIYEQDIGPSF